MNEETVISLLTAGAVLLNVVTAIRALLLASSLEKGDKWVCQSVGPIRAIHILLAISCISLILVVLKTWSIFDVFLDQWEFMTQTYHIRSYAFLAENYGMGMLGYTVITMVNRMTACGTDRRVTDRRVSTVDRRKGLIIERRKPFIGKGDVLGV